MKKNDSSDREPNLELLQTASAQLNFTAALPVILQTSGECQAGT
jgi:hypothetical protein